MVKPIPIKPATGGRAARTLIAACRAEARRVRDVAGLFIRHLENAGLTKDEMAMLANATHLAANQSPGAHL